MRKVDPKKLRDNHDIYVDVDGTLSDSSGRKHHLLVKPKNWKMFFGEMANDPPHNDVVWMVKTLHETGNRIIIATGRPEEHRKTTEDWLKKHQVPYHKLYMRSSGDYRDDSIVKVEMVHQMWEDGFDPTIAFDDRDRVVEALRGIGMRVFQVENGNF